MRAGGQALGARGHHGHGRGRRQHRGAQVGALEYRAWVVECPGGRHKYQIGRHLVRLVANCLYARMRVALRRGLSGKPGAARRALEALNKQEEEWERDRQGIEEAVVEHLAQEEAEARQRRLLLEDAPPPMSDELDNAEARLFNAGDVDEMGNSRCRMWGLCTLGVCVRVLGEADEIGNSRFHGKWGLCAWGVCICMCMCV